MKPLVLICDDDQVLLRRLAQLFERDYKVIKSFTVASSLDLLEADRVRPASERYSVVVIDLAFPQPKGKGTDLGAGFTILNAASKDRFLELIVFTNAGNEEAACRAIAKGARYVAKNPALRNEPDLAAAIRHGVECHKAIVGLAAVIDEIAAASSGNEALLTYSSTVFKHILTLRGRE
jgi:ActR/RegA family two-component response regulator